VVPAPSGGDLDPYAVPLGPFTVYDAHCRTPGAWTVALERGIGQTPLMTKHRYYDAVTDDIDLAKYAEKIWTPGARPECTASLDGVPPWFTGPVWLDYEKWDEFRHPEDYTVEQIVRRFLQYVTLINATRQMRPGCTILLHNMLRAAPENDPFIASLELALHTLVDGTTPSLWVQCPATDFGSNGSPDTEQQPPAPLPADCMSFEESWEIDEQLLERALEVKAATGLGVYPAIWYRYKMVDEPVPAWLMRAHLERILAFEWAGERVDGCSILGGSVPTIEAMIDHMAIAADVAAQVARPSP
jgi:hypothetical protein